VHSELEGLFGIVKEAQAAAIRALAQGVDFRKADAHAREVIREAGYLRNFVHSTGHGIGLEVHEHPEGINRECKDKVEGECVVTIEPGVYLPGQGGVRFEHMVHIGKDDVRILTKF
jgi:Xaa-Pro aminopeptidase